jgi:hypothetical protein
MSAYQKRIEEELNGLDSDNHIEWLTNELNATMANLLLGNITADDTAMTVHTIQAECERRGIDLNELAAEIFNP